MKTVGILALQGDFAAHARALARCEAGRAEATRAVEVRRTAQLAALDGLIIPGGESTTLLNLMRDEPWFDELRGFHARGGAFFGTCAGAILLARQVVGPEQPSLGLLDVTIRRNGYGRQVDSFEEPLDVDGIGVVHAAFIRAPRIERIGANVRILASRGAEPVIVGQDRVLAATFHPELTEDGRLHGLFLDMMATTTKTNRDSGHMAGAAPPAGGAHERRVSC